MFRRGFLLSRLARLWLLVHIMCQFGIRLMLTDRLDPAILDRPIRFDRKYYFDLPAAAERRAYISAWNRELQPELRLSETAAVDLTGQTGGFSFAYLKELFLSSMMQWMAKAGGGSMDEIVLGQADQLRKQMASSAKSKEM